MSQEDIMKDLDSMIKRAAEIKTDGLKKSAAPGGDLGADNGTQAPSTGAHYDKNVEEAGKHTAAKVDGGAEANKPGASVEMSTEGATAVATDGQSGAKGADLDVKKDAANGSVPASELSKTSAALDKCAAEWVAHGKLVSAGLGKIAAELPVDDAAAKATTKLAGILGKSEGQAITAGDLTSFDRFLAKKAAEQGLGGGEEVGQAQAGAGDLMQRLQSGQVSEEEAAKILTEAAQSGALSEQDLAELQQLVEAQGGGAGAPPAPGGDPAAAAGGAPPAPMDPAAMGGAPPAGPDGMIQDPGLEAKVAALHVGPDHPDYGKKLAHFHKEALQFGYDLAVKTAQEVLALEEALEQEKGEKGEGEHAEGDEGKHDEGGEGHKEPDTDDAGAGAPPAAPAGPGAQPDQAAVVDAMTGAGAPPAAPGAPAGPGALPPMAPGAPPAAPGGAMDPGAAGGIPTPKTPEEAAALQQLLQELGMKPEDLAQLQQADVKVAAEHEFTFKARQAILSKVAALRIAATTTNINKGK